MASVPWCTGIWATVWTKGSFFQVHDDMAALKKNYEAVGIDYFEGEG